MDIFKIQDIQTEIFKYLNIKYLLDLLLVSNIFKPILETQKYIQCHQFYKNFKPDNIDLIYFAYLKKACLTGKKYVVQYLMDKYNFKFNINSIQKWFLLSGNLDCCRWFFEIYSPNFNLMEGLGGSTPEIMEFLLQKYPNHREYIITKKIFNFAVKKFNLNMVKYLLGKSNFDIRRCLISKVSFNYHESEFYKMVKYFKQEIGSLFHEDGTPMNSCNIYNLNILKLFFPDSNFSTMDLIRIECDNIQYKYEEYNLDQKIMLIEKLFDNLKNNMVPDWHPDFRSLFESVIGTGESRLIKSLAAREILYKSEIINFMKNINITNKITNLVISTWDIPFEDALSFSSFDYMEYYIRYGLKIKEINNKFTHVNHKFLDLICADNPDITIILNSDNYYGYPEFYFWLAKFFNWDKKIPDRLAIRRYSYTDWSCSKFIDYLIKFKDKINKTYLNSLFLIVSSRSLDLTRKLLIFGKDQLPDYENTCIWLGIDNPKFFKN